MTTSLKNRILFPPASRLDRYGKPVAGNRYRITQAEPVPQEFGGGISFTAESVYEFPTEIPSYITGRLFGDDQTFVTEFRDTARTLHEDRLLGVVQ